MKGVNTNLYTCMALCRIFARGGGDEVAVFKKGVAASSVRGSTGIVY